MATPLQLEEFINLEDRIRQLAADLQTARRRDVSNTVSRDCCGTMRVNVQVLCTRLEQFLGVI